MRIPDVNVLLYAVNADSPDHDAAQRWLDGSLSARRPVGFVWLALVGFMRLSTNPRILPSPLSTDDAAGVVEAWLAARSAHVLHPGLNHLDLLRTCLTERGGRGDLVNDAHIAAVALEHKATVVSFDSDFARFPGVRWERPT